MKTIIRHQEDLYYLSQAIKYVSNAMTEKIGQGRRMDQNELEQITCMMAAWQIQLEAMAEEDLVENKPQLKAV